MFLIEEKRKRDAKLNYNKFATKNPDMADTKNINNFLPQVFSKLANFRYPRIALHIPVTRKSQYDNF